MELGRNPQAGTLTEVRRADVIFPSSQTGRGASVPAAHKDMLLCVGLCPRPALLFLDCSPFVPLLLHFC